MPSDTDQQPQVVTVDRVDAAVVAGRGVPMTDLPDFFARAFPAIAAALAAQGVTPGGPAFALYLEPPGATADLEVGFPTGQPVRADGEVRPGALPGGRVARLVHAGPYEGLPAAWGRLAEWMRQAGATPGGALWEAYLTDPSPGMDPADLRTELNWTIVG